MPETDTLRLDYVLQQDDLMAVVERSTSGALTPGVNLTWRAIAALLGCLVTLISLIIFGRSSWLLALALGAGTMLAWAAVLPPRGTRRRVMTRMAKRLQDPANASMLGRRRLELDALGFAISGENFDLHYRWAVLQKIVVTPQRLFLHVSAIQSHVIPLAASEASQVVQWIRAHAPMVAIVE
jgi:hypothetical protein